ncbi:MAG: DMT family transporter [Erysipelotrichaceae bacterium]
MITGLMAGVLWGLDTVILGIALASTKFVSTSEAIMLAPFVSTFLHDFCSSIWMLIYMGIKKEYKNVVIALKTKSGKFIVLGALLGGPIGMSGYVAAINYIGPSLTAIISALFPAVGAFFSYLFLKEKMKPYQILALLVSILGVIGLGYTPNGQVENLYLGIGCALICVIGWSLEAVICAYGMKDPNVNDEQALQIRQLTSAIFYGVVIITLLSGWDFTLQVSITPSLIATITASALFGTASYLCYYKAINRIGASKAMALNITYCAWSIVFSMIFLQTMPDLKSICFGLVIIFGSIIAATDLKTMFKKSK